MAALDDFRSLIDGAAGRRESLLALDRALQGDHELPYMPLDERSRLQREYNALISRAQTHILGMIIEAQVDRLRVVGFRTDPAAGADMRVWGWWQASNLDQKQVLLYRDSAGYGDGYLLVTPGAQSPVFTVESPLSLSVELDPYDPTRVARAAKVVGDRGWLYTDAEIHEFERTRPTMRWEAAGAIRHNGGECPIVRYPNNLDSLGRASSEVKQVLPIQARINQAIFDRLLQQRSATWKQRWAVGIDVERDDAGNAVAPLETGSDTLWINENPDGKFGEFSATSIEPLIQAVSADISDAAMVTRTPPTFLPQASISNVSGEALVALEAAFTSKIAEKQSILGESHERAMRIGGKMIGYPVPNDAETVWQDLELRSLAQRTDSAVKLRSMGLPMRFVLESMGHSKTEIDRILGEIQAEQRTGAAMQAAAFGVSGPQAPYDEPGAGG